MVQWVKWQFATPFHIIVLVSVPASPFLGLLHVLGLGKAEKDGPSTLVTAIHVGDTDGVVAS